jgi:hypothetical protein
MTLARPAFLTILATLGCVMSAVAQTATAPQLQLAAVPKAALCAALGTALEAKPTEAETVHKMT